MNARAQGTLERTVVEDLQSLQPILRCPVEQTALTLLSVADLLACLPPDERARLPQEIRGAFVSATGTRAYPIVGRIISFLERDALHLASSRSGPASEDRQTERVKQSVQDWYDRFGWTKDEAGLYHDTAMFSQTDVVGHGFYELLSHLGFLDRLGGGEFLLDAASGAMAHVHTLAYSWRYRFRICADLSITALREAEKKVGDDGFCCLADICQLPFITGSIDGIVSAYTIQHIPESEQARAVEELYRVLSPGAHLCILTDVTRTKAHDRLLLAFRAVRKMAKIIKIAAPFRPVPPPPIVAAPPHSLYFITHDTRWWQALGTRLAGSCSVECLRSLMKNEFDRIFGQSNRAARLVRAVESSFPRFLAAASAYCLVDIAKPDTQPPRSQPRFATDTTTNNSSLDRS